MSSILGFHQACRPAEVRVGVQEASEECAPMEVAVLRPKASNRCPTKVTRFQNMDAVPLGGPSPARSPPLLLGVCGDDAVPLALLALLEGLEGAELAGLGTATRGPAPAGSANLPGEASDPKGGRASAARVSCGSLPSRADLLC